MTYDGTDPDDDGVVESDVDNQSTTTQSLDTDQLFTAARGPSVVVHEAEDGVLVADGPSGELASGDITNPSDVTTVIQTALDQGGSIRLKAHSDPYTLGVGGTDKEDVQFCLQMRSDTHLDIEKGATLEYPADTGDSTLDVASPILCSGISNFKITLDGTIDAGYHRQPQPDAHTTKALVIKVGEAWNNDDTLTGSGCENFVIEGSGTLTGACRHAIEVGAPKNESAGTGLIDGLTADDGSGDDDFAIGGPVENVTYRNCVSQNKQRSGDWGSSGFEMDDGPTNCYFLNCVAKDPGPSDVFGFVIGKMHAWADAHPCEGNYAINCVADGDFKYGYNVSIGAHTADPVKDVAVIDSRSKGCQRSVGAQINAVTENIRVEGGTHSNPTEYNLYFGGGSELRGVTIDSTFELSGTSSSGAANVLLAPSGDNFENVNISGVIRDSYGAGVVLDPAGGFIKDLTIRGAEIRDNSSWGIRFKQDNTQWGGMSVVEDNDLRRNDVVFDSSTIREHVVMRENIGQSDWSPVAPVAATESDWYYDDGANTGTATKGKRIYANGAWTDVWTV